MASLRPDLGTTSQQGVKSTSSPWDAQWTPESHFFEAVYVMITVEQSRTAGVPNPPTVAVRRPARPGVPPMLPEGTWEQLDQVDVAETCLMRVPMLKSCPYFLRGRLRECFAMTLRRTVQGEDSS